jgi:hypothetical protein
MDQSIIFFFAGVLVVGGLLFAVISLTKKGPKQLDVEHYRVKWMEIEQQLKKDEPATFSVVVLNADKLLDQALQARGLKGSTTADRMKSASKLFTNRNYVWSAHRLRNKIAHDADVRVTYDDARRALGDFKRALKDVGAI